MATSLIWWICWCSKSFKKYTHTSFVIIFQCILFLFLQDFSFFFIIIIYLCQQNLMIMIFTIRHFVLFLYAGSTHWMIYIYNICVFERTFYIFEQKMLQALLKLGGWLYSRGGVKIYKFFFKKMTKSNFYFCLKLIIIIIKKEIWSQRFFFDSKHTLLETLFSKNTIF